MEEKVLIANPVRFICKLQSKKKDGKWLHAASGEWFEEIQKEKYKDERDVRSLVKDPLACRLQETSRLMDLDDSKMSRLENLPSSKNVNSGPSFLGIRSPFSFFGKFAKQNTKLQERNDLFPQAKSTGNEEKKKAEFFHSTKSVRQTIKFFESFGKKTREHRVPPTNAEIEKEAFEVLGELDKKLAQEKDQQTKNNTSATSHRPDNPHKNAGSLHNIPQPRTEYSTLYFQEKPRTVSVGEGLRTCATYQPKRFDDISLNRNHAPPTHWLSQNNKLEKSPSLFSACSSKTPSSAPSAGTFSAKSLPPPLIEKKTPEIQKNRLYKSRRPLISSVNWDMVQTLDHSEKQHSVFRTQSDMDLSKLSQASNPNRINKLYGNRNYHLEPEFNNANAANIKPQVFHNNNISSGVQNTDNRLFRAQSDLDLTSHGNSSTQNRMYELYKFRNDLRGPRFNHNDFNEVNSVKTHILKNNSQMSPTGVRKTNSSVPISVKNIQEDGKSVWEEENKANACKSNGIEPKYFPVPSSKKHHRVVKPVETECEDKGAEHSTTTNNVQSSLAHNIEAALNTNGCKKHNISCGMQTTTANIIKEDTTVDSEKNKARQELPLNVRDSRVSHLAQNIQEQLSDKCDIMRVDIQHDFIQLKHLPLPEVSGVVPQSRKQDNTLHSNAMVTKKEANPFINQNIDTHSTEPVGKNNAIEVLRNCAAQVYRQEDQMNGENVNGCLSNALRAQSRSSSSLPDLSDWRSLNVQTHLKSSDFNLGDTHFSVDPDTVSINKYQKLKEHLSNTNISRKNIQAESHTCSKQEKWPPATSQRLAQPVVRSCNGTTKSTTEQIVGMRTVPHTRDQLQEEMHRPIHQIRFSNTLEKGQAHLESSVEGIIIDIRQKKADNNNNSQSRLMESSHEFIKQDRRANHITGSRQFHMQPGKGVSEQTQPQLHSALVSNDYQIFNSQDNNDMKKESLHINGIEQSQRVTPSATGVSFQTITNGQRFDTENPAKQEMNTKSNVNQNLINDVRNKNAMTEDVRLAKLSESSAVSPFSSQSDDLADDVCNMSISPPFVQNINLVKHCLIPSPETVEFNSTFRENISPSVPSESSVTTCGTNYTPLNACTAFSFSTVVENTRIYRNRDYVLSDIEKTEYRELVSVYNSLPHRGKLGFFPKAITNKVQALQFDKASSDQLENITTGYDEFDGKSYCKQHNTQEPLPLYNKEHIPHKQGLLSFSDEESLSYDVGDKRTDLSLSQGHLHQTREENSIDSTRFQQYNTNDYFHSESPSKEKWDFYYTLPSRRSHQRDSRKLLQEHHLHRESDIYSSTEKAEAPKKASPNHSFEPNFWKDNLGYSDMFLGSYEKDNINNLINSDNLICNQNVSHYEGLPQEEKLSPLYHSKNMKGLNSHKLQYTKISSSPSIEPLMQNQANFSKVSETLHRNKPPYCPEYLQNEMKALTDTRRFIYSSDDTEQRENEFSSLPYMEHFGSSTRMSDGTNSPYVLCSMNDKYQSPLDPQLHRWGEQTTNQHSNLHRSKSLKGLNVEEEHELMNRKRKTEGKYSSKSTGGMLNNVRPSVFKDVNESKYDRQFSHDILRDENDNCPTTRTGYTHKPVYTSKCLDYGIFGEEQQKAFLNNVKRALTEGRLWRPCFLKNPGFLRSEAHQYRSSQGSRYHSDGDAPHLLCPQGFLNIYEDEVINRSDPETDTTTDDEYYLDDFDRETEL
ncbi:uncharacterized protein LOC121400059 isoform X2 [Xenopus laevis]|uniref:Uncharacterized protein LOC121400059 isoform X2 n=1 Tax=Xenopus laevis TaxID=8355 RepID=A0A8J1MA87_XENLA|nr:uncharacterized protein LOC121400059 isoform X2 [Xenopus laevis]